MTDIRSRVSKKNKYYLSPHAFLTAYHFAMQYHDWREEYNTLISIKGIDYSADKVSSGQNGDPTSDVATKLAEIEAKMRIVEGIAKEVAPEIEKWLLEAVTSGVPYHYLRTRKDIPCGKDYFYEKRRHFYFVLDKKLNKWTK